MATNPLETLRIAHTARCKLNMAASRPDRNFRFILGHALTLDKVMLRVAEIEFTSDDEGGSDSSSGESDDEQLKERHVGFAGPAKAMGTGSQRKTQRRSPPPPQPGVDVHDDEEEDGDDEDGVPLERFPSASAGPPRGVSQYEDEGVGDMKGGGGGQEWSEEQLKRITAGVGSAELVDVYNHVAGCPCHGEKAPAVENVWEIPAEMDGQMGGRLAVVQVRA